jgi:outer membrane lipoprotein-sorting protein
MPALRSVLTLSRPIVILQAQGKHIGQGFEEGVAVGRATGSRSSRTRERRRPALAVLGMALVALAPGLPPDQDPIAIIGRASRIFRGLTSLQADFVQTIEDRSQGDTLTSRGTVVQAGNNHFAMRFSDPPGEEIVVDGKYIWQYTPSTAPNVVYRRSLPTDPVYGVNLLAQLLDRPQDRYKASYVRRDTVSGKPTDVIDLEPTVESVPFRQARLWLGIDDALPRRVELNEGPGLRRTLALSRLRPNASVSRSTFTFSVPAGVRVVADP